MAVSCLPVPAALAGSITATTTAIVGPSNADPAASTFSVFAYSQWKAQKNQKTSTDFGKGVPNVYNAIIAAPLPGGKNENLTPIVGWRDLKKTEIAGKVTGVSTQSESGPGIFGGGLAVGYAGVFRYTDGPHKGQTGINVHGNTQPGAQSIGAGMGSDPFAVDPGVYQYSYGLSFSMEVFPTDPYASFYAGAEDTAHDDPLWSLSVVAYGPITSIGDLTIVFTSDPSLGLNDALVASNLQAAISISGGVASVTDYTLFDTTYYALSPTTYSDHATATTASVPEPCSFALLLGGVLALGALGICRRRARSPTARAP